MTPTFPVRARWEFSFSRYTILLTAVIGSAVVPTLIAQRFFLPAGPLFETTEEDIEWLEAPVEHP
jgi:hypothetical protein